MFQNFFIACGPTHRRENSYVTFGLMMVSASTNFIQAKGIPKHRGIVQRLLHGSPTLVCSIISEDLAIQIVMQMRISVSVSQTASCDQMRIMGFL